MRYAVAYLIIASSPAAAVTFVAESGRGNTNTGPAFNDTTFVWGNTFTTDVPVRLTSVDVAFGRVAAGRPTSILIFDDSAGAGRPQDFVLVDRVEGSSGVSNANSAEADVFTSFVVDVVVQGSFFVAASMDGIDGLSPTRDAPARRDSRTATGQGLIFFGPEGSDVSDLGALPGFIRVGDPGTFGGLAGNNLVRATGVFVPEPALSVAAWAAAGVLLRRRRA